jgi:hypothetical protein
MIEIIRTQLPKQVVGDVGMSSMPLGERFVYGLKIFNYQRILDLRSAPTLEGRKSQKE